jgi:GPH family glycoside/pentoside/hexuronide:cation symporter
MAIEEDLSQWEIASTWKMTAYGIGYVFINYLLGYGLANLFYFYEVEVGLPALYLSAAFVIFAIWNMVNDPLLGYLTDKPKKWTRKYGLRAPWVVVTTFPVVILFYVIWIPPQGMGAMIIFLWFIIITCLFDTFFSIYNDHVYGGFTNQFPSEYERRRAFAIATILMFVLITIMTVIGSITIVYGDPSSFVRWAFLMMIILGIYGIIVFTGIRESPEMKQMFITSYEKAEKIGFFNTMKVALKTKNFAISLSGYTISITATTLMAASTIYLYKDVYRVPYIYGLIPAIVGTIAGLLMIPFWSNYARKHGFKKCYATTYILHGVCFLPFLFITDIIFHTIFWAIYQMIYIGEVTMLMPVASDTYDEVSSKMEKRVDALLVGIRTFFFRVAFLVVGVVIPIIHVMTAYNTNPYAIQTPLAIWGIRIHAALIPGVIMIVMGLIFKKFYTLEGKEKEALVRKLKDLGIYR